jgi:hypothetical protein
MMFTKIKSFNEIEIDINKKTLVICDIDNTVLKYDIPYDFLYKLLQDDLGEIYTEKDLQDYINQ